MPSENSEHTDIRAMRPQLYSSYNDSGSASLRVGHIDAIYSATMEGGGEDGSDFRRKIYNRFPGPLRIYTGTFLFLIL